MRLCSSDGGTNTSVTSEWPSDSARALLGARGELVQDVSHPGPPALGTAHLPVPPVSRSTQHPEPHEADVSIRAEERCERWGHVTVHTTLESPCSCRSSLQLPTPIE